MPKTFKFGFLCLLVLAFSHSKAQETHFGYTSLTSYSGARETALSGKAFSISDNDIHLALLNPALLPYTETGNLALNYTAYFADAKQGYAGTNFRLKNDSVYHFSTSISYFNYGKFTERDIYGNDLGNFGVNDYLLRLGAARNFGPNFSVGINLNGFYSKWYNLTSTGFTADISALYNVPSKLSSISARIRNIGFIASDFTETSDRRPPITAEISYSKKLDKAPFRFIITADELTRFDLVPSNEKQPEKDPFTGEVLTPEEPSFFNKLFRHFYWGTEIVLSKHFHVRGGYSYRKRQELKMPDRPRTVGFSYGFGFRISRFVLNYGRSMVHVSGPNHSISLTVNLKDSSPKRFEKN